MPLLESTCCSAFLATILLIYLATLTCPRTPRCMSFNIATSCRQISPIVSTLLKPSCSRAYQISGLSSAGARRHHSFARTSFPPAYNRLQISTKSAIAAGSSRTPSLNVCVVDHMLLASFCLLGVFFAFTQAQGCLSSLTFNTLSESDTNHSS